MKRLQLLISLTFLLLLVPGLPQEAGANKKDKKRISIRGEVVVQFVSGQDLILAWTNSGGVYLLTYPELEIASHLTVDEQEKVTAMRLSDNRRWLGTRYKKGPLQVWNMADREPIFTLAQNVSMGFTFHPREDRLILFQPKIGVTQWDLATGSQVGPTISEVTSVFLGNIWVSPNGNYLWTRGRCRVPAGSFELCLFDLRDGAAIAWADGRSLAGWDPELLAEFLELAEAMGFGRDRSTAETDAPGCNRQADGNLFCCSSQSVAITDDSRPPADSEPPSGKVGQVMKVFGAPTATRMTAEYPGRYLWQIRASQERKRLFIHSCDLSADGKWVLLGVNGVEVDLFSTEELEPKSLRLMGSWQQPLLVDSIELP